MYRNGGVVKDMLEEVAWLESRTCAMYLMEWRKNSAMYYHALTFCYDDDRCCNCIWSVDDDTCAYFNYRERLCIC